MKFTEYISSQFGNPRGMIGKICCLIMNMINSAMYKSVISYASNQKLNNILDIGFGNGYLVKKMYQKTQAKIYGIDISQDMLETATQKNLDGIQEKRIQLAIGDCCDLQFEDHSFDMVSSVNTIYFWPDPLKGLQEIYRTLQEGGSFVNVVYSKEWLQKLSYTKTGFQFFEKTDYEVLGKQAGFSDVVIEEIVNGKSYFIKYIK